jgi:hypothetical protein
VIYKFNTPNRFSVRMLWSRFVQEFVVLVEGTPLLAASKRDIEASNAPIQASTEDALAFISQLVLCIGIMNPLQCY